MKKKKQASNLREAEFRNIFLNFNQFWVSEGKVKSRKKKFVVLFTVSINYFSFNFSFTAHF